ncbi:MAG: HEAT repeat domain-containing protein [Planctomycetes bacterium]|nr:HEAT repeat domain-containing protein [Planctomycetota bacterium]
MNSNRSVLPLLTTALVAGAIGFGAGVWIATSGHWKPSGPSTGTGPAVTSPGETNGSLLPAIPELRFPDVATAVRAHAEALHKQYGPFQNAAESSHAAQLVVLTRQAVLRFGAPAFEAITTFLGPAPGTTSDGGIQPPRSGAVRPELNPEVREGLVRILPELDPERAAPELATRLLNDNEHGRVRGSAAGLLGKLDRKIAVPALVKALDDASTHDWAGSRDILDGIQLQGGPEAEEILQKVLARPTTPLEMRIRVCECIGELKVAAAVPALATIIRFEESNHYLRRAAVRALLKIDPARADAAAEAQYPEERDEGFRAWLAEYLRTRGRALPPSERR